MFNVLFTTTRVYTLFTSFIINYPRLNVVNIKVRKLWTICSLSEDTTVSTKRDNVMILCWCFVGCANRRTLHTLYLVSQADSQPTQQPYWAYYCCEFFNFLNLTPLIVFMLLTFSVLLVLFRWRWRRHFTSPNITFYHQYLGVQFQPSLFKRYGTKHFSSNCLFFIELSFSLFCIWFSFVLNIIFW